MKYLIVLTFVFAVSLDLTWGFRVNITNFGNCSDIMVPQVYLTSVRYEYVNGLCDTVHGSYMVEVAELDKESKYELWIVSYQCRTNSLGPCAENKRIKIEELQCDRLHGDKTGPWAMLSDGMTGSKCGELTGEFKLDTAPLKAEYLRNFIVEDKSNARHRLELLFHKRNETLDKLRFRGCVSIEFDLIYA